MLRWMQSTVVKVAIWLIIAATFLIGFNFFQGSGLMGGGGAVTPNTAIAKVNGETILATDYFRAVDARVQQENQRTGHALTLDERRQVEQQVFDEMVTNILLQQELERRHIGVTDAEIVQAAQTQPPPELLENPELQTNGQFDPEKYRRFLANPAARAQGLLQYLEQFYRTELPRQKLFTQVAAEVYVTDDRLWQLYQDQHDSAQVSYVVLRPELVADNAVQVSDGEIQQYYDAHKKSFERPGRAVLSLLTLPRTVTGADSAAARARAEQLKAEIARGAKFEDIAKRESADSGSAAQGGALGKGGRNRFVPEFERAAYALRPGQVSDPVLTQFGYHLIRVDSRSGDTLDVRHILVPITQSDSSAARVDRRADSLANAAASSEDPSKFDAAARHFGLTPRTVVAFEGEPLTVNGRPVPSVDAWAFGGVKAGETSELFDAPDAYYLARVDSIASGGQQPLTAVRGEIRDLLVRRKKLESLMPRARTLAEAARASTLEAAAAQQHLTVQQTPQLFARSSLVPGLGQFTEAVGAAFGVPQGQITAPVQANDGVYVLRVDRRISADKGQWQAQKAQQRQQVTPAARQARVREFLAELRAEAKIDDRRQKVLAAQRKQSAG